MRTRRAERLPDYRWWALIAPSFLLFWVAGLGMVWIAFVPPLVLFQNRKKLAQRSAKPGKWLLLLAIWLALGLGLALGVGTAEPNRVLGAAFAVAAWFGAWCLYRVLTRANGRQLYRFISGLAAIAVLQGAATLAAILAHPSPLSSIRLPAAAAFSGSNVAPWTTARLVIQTWFGETALRSNGFMATAAWTGGFAALMIILLWVGRSRLRTAGMSRLFWLAAFAFSGVSLYYSLSRLSQAIALSVVAIATVYGVCRWLLPVGGGAISTILLFIGGITAPLFIDIAGILNEQDALRPGSSFTRFASYLEGIDAVVSGGPFVIIAGNGFKPYFEEQDRGVGSESTYISLLVRGGVVAVFFFVAFLASRMREAIRERDWTAVAIVAATAVHAIAADLDVGTMTIVLALLMPGRMLLDGLSESSDEELRRLPAVAAR